MAILAECPICRKKQATKNKICSCGEELDKAKRSKRVKYWIQYRLPNGKQRKEFVGNSIEEARDADGKRKVQKRENRIFDMLASSKITFQELTNWYVSLEKVKALRYYKTVKIKLGIFNSEFGDIPVRNIQPADLEDYQLKRKAKGLADATVDQDIKIVQAMINKGFDNDKVGGGTLKAFRRVKKLLKPRSNIRDRILSLDEFHGLIDHLPGHLKPIVATGFYTGMRKGEIVNLTWDKVDMKSRLICLEVEDTKDKEARNIPIMDELYAILKSIPRAIHDNHVFLFKGKPIKDIRTGLVDACQKAGIIYGRSKRDGFIFHDLRHSFNTYMRKAGVDKSVIKKITGHATDEMFDRYDTIDVEDTRLAVDQLRGYFANVTQTVTHKAKSETQKQAN